MVAAVFSFPQRKLLSCFRGRPAAGPRKDCPRKKSNLHYCLGWDGFSWLNDDTQGAEDCIGEGNERLARDLAEALPEARDIERTHLEGQGNAFLIESAFAPGDYSGTRQAQATEARRQRNAHGRGREPSEIGVLQDDDWPGLSLLRALDRLQSGAINVAAVNLCQGHSEGLFRGQSTERSLERRRGAIIL